MNITRFLNIWGIIFFIFCFHLGSGNEQKRTPQGHFLEKSLKVGQHVHYSLSIKHDPSQQIIFPDSTYDFGNFEYVNKKYFPTYTSNNISTDSVIYTLTTFELQDTLSLKIPVYAINEADTNKIYPEKDHIVLKRVIKPDQKKQKLKANTFYQEVKKRFNYPLLWLIIIGILIIIIANLLIFGQTLQKKIKIYRMQHQYRKFLQQFVAEEAKMYENPNPAIAESALHIWKGYLRKLLSKPVSSYSSKEILQMIPDEQLKADLNTIDKAIYGKKTDDNLKYAVTGLKNIAKKQYETQRREVLNG